VTVVRCSIVADDVYSNLKRTGYNWKYIDNDTFLNSPLPADNINVTMLTGQNSNILLL
jgi:hypothetical protein